MSNVEDVEMLQKQIESLSARCAQESCEKIALDSAYAESIRSNHQIRTQLEMLKAENARLVQNCKNESAEKEALQKELGDLQERYNVAVKRVMLLETEAVSPAIDGA